MTGRRNEEEVRPLVSTTSNKSPYGVYDDEYISVDEDSRNIVKRRRLMKYGGIIVVVAALTAVVATSFTNNQAQNKQAFISKNAAAVQADHLFAGLLADEEAFYFPTTLKETEDANVGGSRRMLRALAAASSAVDWSYDWTTNAKDGAAVGEYYRAKGLAMADYYRSKFDPTYKVAAKEQGASAPQNDVVAEASPISEDASTWTYDWKADMDRGIALGQHYKAIGDTINAHYREAFDPTYPAANDDDDENADRRMLKSKEKKLKDRKKKELAVDMAARDNGQTQTATGWYDWQTDRDRGMAIGMHYKQMGQEIADHYNKEFNPMYDVNKKAYTDKNWATMWQDYQKRGQEISNYYKSKGAAIDKFYQGKYTLEGMASPIVDGSSTNDDGANADNAAATAEGAAVGNNPDAAYIWGLDWQKDREHAMAIHEDMMKKGLAVGDYYRSKYDPTYGTADTAAVPASAQPNLGNNREDDASEEVENEDDAAVAPTADHHPDLDYPPWGVDPAADREHGIAIGQYWKNKGMSMGTTYQKRGMELGKYYEDKYRSQFDPTYIAAEEQEEGNTSAAP